MRTTRRSLRSAPRPAAFLAPAVALLALCAATAGASSPPRVVGQVLSDESRLDGVHVPSGTTLLADSLLATDTRPALVHLRGGRVLWLDRHTSAYFEETPEGELKMDVRAGQLTVRGPEGRPLTVKENDFAVLPVVARLESRPGIDSPAAGIQESPQEPPPVGSGAEVGAPLITGAGKACLPDVPYPLIDASIRPGPDVRVAKVYFRAAQHPDFYAVEMTGAADDFEGILPAPGPDTEQVVYYVEAVALSFESSRTQEYVADVVPDEDCRDRGGAARFLGQSPQIRVLSTAEGAAVVPPGFSSLGIVNATTTAATGAAVGGGGLSSGAITGIVIGGALGVGVVINELDDNEVMEASGAIPVPVPP